MKQVTILTKVEASFMIPGVGPIKESYRLGYADDMILWSLNERLARAIQTDIRVTETKTVPEGHPRHIRRSRDGMKPYIKRQIAEQRAKLNRAALA